MLAENRVPTRWDLDAVSPHHPVYIQAIWGYWGWPPLVSVLNSRALELCGITRHTQPPGEGEADRRVGIRDKRFVIQHLQFATPRQLDRMKALDLVVGVHPNNHIWKRGRRHLTPEGRRQIDRVTPMRDLIDRGIPVTVETDGSPIDMLHALWVILARRERETGELIAPEQRISRPEASRASTLNGAYLTLEEHKKGSLEPGKGADIVVLEEDLLTAPEDRVKDLRVRMTVVGGQIVHDSAAAKAQ